MMSYLDNKFVVPVSHIVCETIVLVAHIKQCVFNIALKGAYATALTRCTTNTAEDCRPSMLWA